LALKNHYCPLITGAMTRALPNGFPPMAAWDAGRSGYGFGYEARAVHDEIGAFDWYNSPAYHAIKQHFGETLRLKELKGLINAATFYLKEKQGKRLPDLSRNAKRNFPLLIKYVQANYEFIVPVLPKLSLCDSDRRPLPLLDVRAQNH
jgi:hypothetical protein